MTHRRSAAALATFVLASSSLWGCAAAPESESDEIGVAVEALEVSRTASPAFIDALYVDLLGRHASAAESRSLSGFARSVVVDVVLDSGEYRSRRIGQLFGDYLGRPPTDGELAACLPLSAETVAEKIFVSAAYASNATFVKDLYRDLLGRSPTEAEVSAFAGKARLDVVRTVQNSAEARSRVAARVFAALHVVPADPREVQTERELTKAVASSDAYAARHSALSK